jgi:chaperonin GroES
VGTGKAMQDGGRATMSVQEGDAVIFGKYSGTDVKVDDIEYKIMRESDLLGKYLN